MKNGQTGFDEWFELVGLSEYKQTEKRFQSKNV
jgi:hypothetical protein